MCTHLCSYKGAPWVHLWYLPFLPDHVKTELLPELSASPSARLSCQPALNPLLVLLKICSSTKTQVLRLSGQVLYIMTHLPISNPEDDT